MLQLIKGLQYFSHTVYSIFLNRWFCCQNRNAGTIRIGTFAFSGRKVSVKGCSMPKKTPDYDNVFKTMKFKHKRLFISVINDIFGKYYPLNSKVSVLPSEGFLTENETIDDNSMAIRIAEYAFIVAGKYADWDIGHAIIRMPRFAVIYIRKTASTPQKTTITFKFPDGQSVDYESDNVILENLTKEYIIEKRLFPYIPFYIARYEQEITNGNNIDKAVNDLQYFRDEMLRLQEEGGLSDDEIVDLMGFVNTIITHITNGNQNEERMVSIMGGVILETESEKLIRQGKVQMIIEMGREYGLDDVTILNYLQDKTGLSLERAAACLEQYKKQPV